MYNLLLFRLCHDFVCHPQFKKYFDIMILTFYSLSFDDLFFLIDRIFFKSSKVLDYLQQGAVFVFPFRDYILSTVVFNLPPCSCHFCALKRVFCAVSALAEEARVCCAWAGASVPTRPLVSTAQNAPPSSQRALVGMLRHQQTCLG